MHLYGLAFSRDTSRKMNLSSDDTGVSTGLSCPPEAEYSANGRNCAEDHAVTIFYSTTSCY
jgi:hypothetical protein